MGAGAEGEREGRVLEACREAFFLEPSNLLLRRRCGAILVGLLAVLFLAGPGGPLAGYSSAL